MPEQKLLQFPKLHRHKTGQFFSKWAGTFHYYGNKAAEAQDLYLADMARWQEWRSASRVSRRAAPARPLFVAQLVARFLEFKLLEGGEMRRRYYANHLRRFAHGFGAVYASAVRASSLQALKEDMLRAGYDPRTINHDLGCVKAMFNWASGMELVPAVNLRFAKPMALPPTEARALEVGQVKDFLRKVDDRIKPWLAVQYLTMMRPSEVVRVVNEQGTWEHPWLFRLHTGKTILRTHEHRRIVFSAAALAWLKRCQPWCSRQDSYYRGVARCLDACDPRPPYTPHVLRHSAATHLAQLGVARPDIDLLLGHLPPRVSRTYVQIDWSSLRDAIALLRLPRSV